MCARMLCISARPCRVPMLSPIPWPCPCRVRCAHAQAVPRPMPRLCPGPGHAALAGGFAHAYLYATLVGFPSACPALAGGFALVRLLAA